MSKIIKIILPLIIFGATLAAYIYTLAPSIVAGDTTEMINAALVLGIPHQQSYPFTTLTGYIFSLLPFGPDKVWRVNASSAFFESLTCVLIYFVILQLFRLCKNEIKLQREKLKLSEYLIALSASLFLGFSLTFWQLGTKAEVFPLNNFLSALIILSGLQFILSGKKLWLYLTVFIISFAFSHHQTSLLVVPGILILAVWKDSKIFSSKKVWLVSSLIFLAGLVPYIIALILLARGNPAMNWGNPDTVGGALRALARTDFGSFAYLKEGQTGATPPAINQVTYYIQSLYNDFTLWGIILAVLGGIYLWRQTRIIFAFIGGSIITAIIFFMYAAFTMSDATGEATLKRFQLLPDMFFSLFIAFGLFFILKKIESLSLDYRKAENKFSLFLVVTGTTFIFLFPLWLNFAKADNRNNLGTIKFARDVYSRTEPDAIIMLAGDVPNFAASFEKTVESKDDHRIVFSPGQFHLAWFIPQLEKKYPDIIIPPPLPGNRFAVTSQVIEANLGKRPIYISPELAFHDPQVEKNYVLWPHNLLFLVMPKGKEAKLENYREESKKLYESINLSWFGWVKSHNPLMENVIVGYYAQHFHNLGYMYESVKLYEDAITEYKRALTIDPDFEESSKNLGMLYGFTLEPRDYQQAVGYLSKYLALVEKKDPALAESARYTIAKLYEENNKEVKRLQDEEATRAAQPKTQEEASGADEQNK